MPDIRFTQFDLPDAVQRGLSEVRFSHCTPIQARALPLLLAGRDVAGQAQTGTGKTAAFLVALYTRLIRIPAAPDHKPTQPRAVILAPTRELAIQIHKDALQLGRHTEFKLGLIYGGIDYIKQRDSLTSGVDILIGTPGRIIDYFKQDVFDLRAVEVMVLDEADRMFDLGFIKDIRFLLRRMPKPEQRLSMLFSATLSYRVMELAYEHMNNPELIKIESERVTADKVRQLVYHPSNSEKIPLLLGLLRQHRPERTLIFVNTRQVAEQIAAYLAANGFKAASLTGDVPQRKRQRLLQGFLAGEYPLLVATDVASRGLHIPAVSHVINFDVPESEEDYVHRIGRTARAGAEGDAISFACEDYSFHLPDIEAFIGHKIPVADIRPELLITPHPPVRGEHEPRVSAGKKGTRHPRRRRSIRGA
ncbi:MAG TPA: DEAD/DEAH box helicase [Gammaproteobacteria bacterium]|nr:DEAD/DEAH box helicase [Gammaproteobacteria bacterium]